MNFNKYNFACYVFLFAGLILLQMGCKSPGNSGELVGVQLNKLKANKTPHGMVLIPGGTFIMGQSDEDITFSQTAQNRQVTIAPFYMDDTEISNSEYRQFVFWVRDSVLIHNFLGDDTYFIQSANGDKRYIDWDKVYKNSPWKSKDPNVLEKISSMYYQGEDRIFGKNELDPNLLRYHYEWYDLQAAIAAKGNPTKKRSDFIRRDTMFVYPDTTVWLADFSYAQNEPMVNGYFSHPSYNEYPVVGVTWRQAQAFNVWRTRLFNNAAYKNKQQPRLDYELPSEAQWEYAARGGKVGMQYPWGGPTARNARGCLMANFKPGRGNYMDDGAAYTAPVYSYFPNDFGLYNMAGNVAEWTKSTYNESAYSFVHDMNPTYTHHAKADDPLAMKRKVVRGGSWKDIGFFLQNGTRQYEYQDTAKSYIGFRSITNFPGVTH
ncbi:SUMF1/EgtB/PvdO family nonheme iron enzyme [Parapedobacter sp. SGR-10]|uniref:type IX secretion system lipoprotein PorK/GldK n=1 Tax=Parapedobacter sp. SGR-10 TaxID=2710879 RepID=UPI00197F1FC1|nr:SUMF1/EgtB/PvdO family nonheme iron enzyme [Parapedobacter sp. SGR-10]